MPAHALDAPEFARRLRSLRALGRGVVAAVAAVGVMGVAVVAFALNGEPLAGYAVTVGGVPAVTAAAGVVTALAPVVAVAVSRSLSRAGVRTAAERTPDPAADADTLFGVFAGATFAEFAVGAFIGFAWGALYHLTADPYLLAFLAAVITFLIFRSPTTAWAKAWFDRASEQLAADRAGRLPSP